MIEQKYDFFIDQYTRTFIDNAGHKVYLTAKEFDLFYLLFTHKEQVFSKEQLYESVWGYDYAPDAKNLSSFIRRLRKKVEQDPDNPQYILTVWGVGYKFNKEKP
ncbi:winged helix-turn-helix domain-containing protein [Clostridium tetani]|uniref:winged helix-turn-helix domain-containing protein n=1 Tax=Clostridium tetani TaxID=1513 RepID=UPI00295471FA|nr:helix-turn-helix domain-containing protein [Clostridium tetani]